MAKWLECWGTYAKTGPYNNVAMGGSPNNTIHGLNLLQAKSKSYGQGVLFENINNQIKVTISLIGYSVNEHLQALLNQHYVSGNFTYDWFLDVYVSENNQQSWQVVENNIKIASHSSSQNLAYANGWEQSNVKFAKVFNLPNNFTHVKIEVRGEQAGQRHQNIYKREQVIQDFKPWAIRKANIFKSLNVSSGFFKIRKSYNWIDKSKNFESDLGKNQGASRIRKDNKWKAQNKIGQ